MNRSTDCSNFSLRLRKPESLFSLLLEPASDYRDGIYTYYYRKHSGERSRDDYASAALETRKLVQHQSVEGSDTRLNFDKPMQTLCGLMYKLLGNESREIIERLIRDKAQAENFGHYLKNGFLLPVQLSLSCTAGMLNFARLLVQAMYNNAT